MCKCMRAKSIISIYDKILVLATNGKEYALRQYYPIYMEVKDHPNRIFLDTGGHMEGCDFFQARIEDNNLMRLCDDDIWRKIATLKYPVENKED